MGDYLVDIFGVVTVKSTSLILSVHTLDQTAKTQSIGIHDHHQIAIL